MFDVGGGELLLIVIAVLVLFGPKKIPEVARMVSKGMRHLKNAQAQFKSQLDDIQGDLDPDDDIFSSKKKQRDFSNPPPYMQQDKEEQYPKNEDPYLKKDEEKTESDDSDPKDSADDIEVESTAKRFRPKKPSYIKDDDESQEDTNNKENL